MAATVSAWGKPGAWALDSEETEAELLNQYKQESASVKGFSNGVELTDYPSLAAAASTKTKKKKPQTLSLQEFATYGAPKQQAAQSKGLTPEELLVLPTGPRERSAEELDRNRLGGGFRSYGGGARDDQPRRQGNFNRDSSREFTPSRADEIENWGAGKKPSVNNGFERRERGGFFEDLQSRADEVDNWTSKKSFVPSEPKKYDRRGSFGTDSISGGADSENWLKRKEEEGRKTGGSFDSLRERRGGFESNGADSESWGRKREEVTNGSGRPRLNLQPRTLPVGEGKKSDMGSAVKPKGSNPFGEARPREEVLKEKGLDRKEIEEMIESTKAKEIPAMGSNDVPVVERKNFWSGNGSDRLQREDKIERAWRKPHSLDSRPSRAPPTPNPVLVQGRVLQWGAPK
ncbi:eukaryotic translation initiation factor 3 subunit A [Dorcoceras hygrometricum]|uniref:Eukaryotic translation initiation factor 3 subunit A n=1 Tax=Dorcoceras hygrometricum TaxID=472368 RepID=A0A2Z7C2G9_9LAMI|nr:eukaryotic translation initiation factor 3 subunit A [Dorcoceras hygrometricum]